MGLIPDNKISVEEAFGFMISYMAVPPETPPSFSAKPKPTITATRTSLLDQQWCNPSSFPRKKLGSTTPISSKRGEKTRVDSFLFFLFSSSYRRSESS